MSVADLPVRRHLWVPACAVAVALLALTACSDDDPEPKVPDATLTVANDLAQTDWSQLVTVNVLANDSASAGTISLSAVGTPAHGTARIDAGRLVYTPAAGYFGTDSVTYTARAEQGGATAAGSVAITVTAAMTLTGVIADLALPGAEVRLTVGTATQTTTADAQGRFTLQLRTPRPDDTLSLQATGVGASSHIKLASQLGDALAVGALASTAGEVSADSTPLLRLSPASTALAAWVAEANGGTVPGTRAQIDALILRGSPSRVAAAATAIRLIGAFSVALPTGVPDTLALVAAPASSTVLADFLAAQQDLSNAVIYNRYLAASATAVVDAAAPMKPPAQTQPRSMAYVVGYRQEGYAPMTVTYRANGTATVVTLDGSREATWRIDSGILKVSLLQPYSSEQPWVDNSTGLTWAARIDLLGYQLRAVTTHMVVRESQSEGTWLAGPKQGSKFAVDSGGGFVSKAVELATTPEISVAEMPIGARWAGLHDTALDLADTDILEVTAAASARFRRSGRTVSWALASGWLQISTPTLDRRYRRMWSDPTGGDEQWLACDFQANVIQRCHERFVVRPIANAGFANNAGLYRRWLSSIGTNTVYAVYSDGTGLEPSAATWSIDADGMFTLRRASTAQFTRERQWILLRTEGSRIYVLEHLKTDFLSPNTPDVDQWRTNIYIDLGSSGR